MSRRRLQVVSIKVGRLNRPRIGALNFPAETTDKAINTTETQADLLPRDLWSVLCSTVSLCGSTRNDVAWKETFEYVPTIHCLSTATRLQLII